LLTLIVGVFLGSLFVFNEKDESNFLIPPVKMAHAEAATSECKCGFAGDNPSIESLPNPEYPLEAFENRAEGNVDLEIEFRADSTIGEIKVINGQPFSMTESAIDAAKKISFTPAYDRKGKFYTSKKEVSYHFYFSTIE
jgi:TonB family protein